MRSYVLILFILEGYVLNTCPGHAALPRIEVKEITVRIDNSSLRYPDFLVLLPENYPSQQRHLLFHQLRHDVTENHLTSEDDRDDVGKSVEAVLRAADLLLKANNTDNGELAKRDTTSMHVYLVASEEPAVHRRGRRSSRLVRSPYTKQWQDICESCPSLAPQQPVVINIIKTGSGCGSDCSPPQTKLTSCGHPQCEPHFPHHPFMFHPPPHPPPHLHHYPPPPPPPPPHHFHHYPPPPIFHHQPVYHSPSPPARPANNIPKQPQQPARPSAPVNQCDPCAAPAPASRPSAAPAAPNYAGSFSQSSASASAQSSSFSWNGKK